MSGGRSIHVEGLGHNAPIPLGAKVGGVIFSSGIGGQDRATGKAPADGAEQVHNAFANLVAFLEAAGATPEHLVRVSIALGDNSLRSAINDEWLAMFPDEDDRPARHIHEEDFGPSRVIQLEVVAVVGATA